MSDPLTPLDLAFVIDDVQESVRRRGETATPREIAEAVSEAVQAELRVSRTENQELAKYAKHKPTCMSNPWNDNQPCSCGLAATLAVVSKYEKAAGT